MSPDRKMLYAAVRKTSPREVSGITRLYATVPRLYLKHFLVGISLDSEDPILMLPDFDEEFAIGKILVSSVKNAKIYQVCSENGCTKSMKMRNFKWFKAIWKYPNLFYQINGFWKLKHALQAIEVKNWIDNRLSRTQNV